MSDKEINLPGIFREGYGFVPKLLLKAEDINSNTKLILCYLLSYTGAGMTCFPNIEDIASHLSISKRTIIRCIRSAIDAGYIHVDKKHLGRGKGSSNIYTLDFMADFGKKGSDKLSPEKKASATEDNASDNRDTLQVTPGNRNNNRSKSNTNNNKEEIEIPPELESIEFITAYEEWVEHRKQIKKKLTPLTIKKQLQMLSKYPIHTAIKMIEQAIEKGWTGIFPVKDNSQSSNVPLTQFQKSAIRQGQMSGLKR